MELAGTSALVTGGAGGLGEACVRGLVDAGVKVVIADRDSIRGKALAESLEGWAVFVDTDVTDEDSVSKAIEQAYALGSLRIVNMAHGASGGLTRIVKADGSPHNYADYKRTVDVYLNGSFNVLRLTAAAMAKNEPLEYGERGVVVMTASIAGFEGTVGQGAYAAAKGGIIGLTLVAARDLAVIGVRVMTIAPGTFTTPAYRKTDDELEEIWGPRVPFPPRMGRPGEYARLLLEICRNSYLNGEIIRIDGAMRFGPRYPRPS
jgi:NAD(P)-dependent dehydrogenase (short-subunit alcohol dehydrogenase family)